MGKAQCLIKEGDTLLCVVKGFHSHIHSSHQLCGAVVKVVPCVLYTLYKGFGALIRIRKSPSPH